MNASSKNQKFVTLWYITIIKPLWSPLWKAWKFKNMNFQNSLKHNLHLFPTLGGENDQDLVLWNVDFYLMRSQLQVIPVLMYTMTCIIYGLRHFQYTQFPNIKSILQAYMKLYADAMCDMLAILILIPHHNNYYIHYAPAGYPLWWLLDNSR